MNNVENHVICLTKDNYEIYVPTLNSVFSLQKVELPVKYISLVDFFKLASSGTSFETTKVLFEEPQGGSDFWNYVRENRRQFISKKLVCDVIEDMKLIFNKLSYYGINSQTDRRRAYKFLELNDFCVQTLASGMYCPANINDCYDFLDDKQLMEVMCNHIRVVSDKVDLSTLQEDVQHDVLEHVLSHVVTSYWEWQGWIKLNG
jgi:hypothetical protein